MTTFDPERSDAIRAGLVENVQATQPRRRRAVWATGLVLAGVLAGATASAGAFAATGMLGPVAGPILPSGQPTPALPDAVVAPDGIVPGAPLEVLVGDSVTVPFADSTEIPLGDRPTAATHARVTITALTAGSLVWGTDAGGNNPSGTWGSADVADGPASPVWYDFPLDDSVVTLYLEPNGLDGIATVQFVTLVPTLFRVNESGQSYGVSGTQLGEPDLVSVSGIAPDGSTVGGYVLAEDLQAFSPDHPGQPKNPKQALEWQEKRDEHYPDGWDIPVYESDGVTQIGVFHVGG